MPQPVASADRDLNRSITLAEFRLASAERFQLLDRAGDRQLSLLDLQALRSARPVRGQRAKPPKDGRDARIAIPIPLDD
jgi:protein tyrosine/serine phosphatase